MATELETPGDSHQQCVERGTRLLSTLKRAARAARLEAEVAELQLALDEARAGEGRRLLRWLNAFENGRDVLEQVVATGDQIAPSTIAQDAALEPATIDASPEGLHADMPVDGWAALLPHAQRRLRERSQAPPGASQAYGVEMLATEACPMEPRAAETLPTETLATEALAIETLAIDEVDGQAMADESGDSAPSPALEILDIALLGAVEREAEAERKAAINRPMMSGMSLSLIAHIALLLALFMITYRLPREPASLGGQVVSVTAVTENVEVSQPVDLPQPVELELAELASPSVGQAMPTALSELSPPRVDVTAPAVAAIRPTGGPLLSAAAAAGSNGSRGGGGERGSGGPALSKIGGKFFGVGAGGNFFCYVVDSSGSMRGVAWQSAKDELLRSLGTLSQRQRFLIVFFAKEFEAIPEPGARTPALHGLLATPQNIDHARRWIETIKLGRGGPPNDALAWAIEREPDAIYLLTDGVTKTDVCGFLREKNRISDLISGQRARVPIHAIAYQSLEGQQLLRQIAGENEGQFHYVPGAKR